MYLQDINFSLVLGLIGIDRFHSIFHHRNWKAKG